MSPMDERTQILRAFKTLGPQLERAEGKRAELYAAQNALILRGDAIGLSAKEMAEARKPDGDARYVAESFRQVLRKSRKPPARAAKKKTA